MQYFNDIFTALSSFSHSHFWVVRIFFVVLITVIIHGIEIIFYKRAYRRVIKKYNFWDNALLKSLHRPLGFLIWIWSISYIALIAKTSGHTSSHTSAIIFHDIQSARNLAVLCITVWFVLRFFHGVERSLLTGKFRHKKIDATAVHAIRQLLSALAVISTILAGMEMLGLPISGLVAFGGIGGAAIAFSAKDVLANFFGGLMVYLDRPFKVGDWIRSPDRQIEGNVEQIGWRLTRIRTFDRRPLYVPNYVFSTIAVENPSRMSNRRIYTNIGLRYEDATKISAILKDVEKMLRNHAEIDTSQQLIVNLVEFGPSSLNFMIYTFTKTTKWVKFQAIQQDVFLKVIEIIDAHGAQCAFPTTTLHLPEGFNNNKASVYSANIKVGQI